MNSVVSRRRIKGSLEIRFSTTKFLMPRIFEHFTEASFQVELLIMTLLGLVNSTRHWSSFDWTIQVDKIWKLPLSDDYSGQKFNHRIKGVLSSLVIVRIIVAHLYPLTYLANIYPILTRCRPGIFFPWMIISAFQNFVLELVAVTVTLLLYLEGEFSGALFTEFIICKAISLAPAIYYWCTVNLFYLELGDIQKRKSTRMNFPDPEQKFMSLTNLDDFSLQSSFEFDGRNKNYRLSKSLTTLLSMNIPHFAEDEEDCAIIEDSSLTPAEKAMRILSINHDDVNATRVRLGKCVLPTVSSATKTEKIGATIDTSITTENIEVVATKSDSILLPISSNNVVNDVQTEEQTPSTINESPETEESLSAIIMQEDKLPKINEDNIPISPNTATNIAASNEMHLDERSSSKIDISYKSEGQLNSNAKQKDTNDPHNSQPRSDVTPSRGLLNMSVLNPLPRCYCRKSDDESVLELRKNTKTSINESLGEGRSSGYEEDNDDSSRNSDSLNISRQSSKQDVIKESNTVRLPDQFPSIDHPQLDIHKDDSDLWQWPFDDDAGNSEVGTAIFRAFQVNHRVTLQSFFIQDLEKENVEWMKSSFQRSDDLDGGSHLFDVKDISMEQKEQSEENFEIPSSGSNNASSSGIQTRPSFFKLCDSSVQRNKQSEKTAKIVGKGQNSSSQEVNAQTIFNGDIERRLTDEGVAEVESLQCTAQISSPTQANINDSRKKTLINVKIKPHILTEDLSNSKLPDLRIKSKQILTGVSRFIRSKKKLKKIEDREAREMKALKIYNRETLLKDKREMEAKKHNSALHRLVCSLNVTNANIKKVRGAPKVSPNQEIGHKKEQPPFDHQIPKRQTRSRPQEQISKFSTFNLGLDALENSISLSFANDNKNRSRFYDTKTNPNRIPPSSQQNGRKQLTKYTKPLQILNELTGSSLTSARHEGLQTGRHLDRTRGMENIIRMNTIQEINHVADRYTTDPNRKELHNVLSETMLTPLGSQENKQSNIAIEESYHRKEFEDKHDISSLREAIKNINWKFDNHNFNTDNSVSRETFIPCCENVLYDIIDDTDTISLLRSAFSWNPENTGRGFYLGPGSTELYSVSSYLDGAIEEIMKTAGLRPNPDIFTVQPTIEVDYGDSYLQEFEITSFFTVDESAEETLSVTDTDSKQFKGSRPEEVVSDLTNPMEMCWSSYSGEGFNARSNPQCAVDQINMGNEKSENESLNIDEYRKKLLSKNREGVKSIGELLGEQEMSHLEFWTKELKDLASTDLRNDLEFRKGIQHLTNIPGFYVVKMLVDFFREFIAVSRSTMTSRIFFRGDTASTPSSVGSDEIILGRLNAISSASVANESLAHPQNWEPFEHIDDEVADSLRSLIDQLTEFADRNRPRYNSLFENPAVWPVFRLSENQFYFGTLENTRRVIKENLSNHIGSKSDSQEDELIPDTYNARGDLDRIDHVIIPQEIEALQIPNEPSVDSKVPNTTSKPECSLFNDTSFHLDKVPANKSKSPKNTTNPFRNDSTVDSFDSLYSNGAAGNSKCCENISSIAGRSSIDDFSKNTVTSTSSIELQLPCSTETADSKMNK